MVVIVGFTIVLKFRIDNASPYYLPNAKSEVQNRDWGTHGTPRGMWRAPGDTQNTAGAAALETAGVQVSWGRRNKVSQTG